MVRRLVYSILCIAALVAAMSFKEPDKAKLTIRFENYVGDKPLQLDSVSYKNLVGQSYTVIMFKYYVGNFRFKNSEGIEFVQKGYYLINQEDNNSMQINVDNIPDGKYTSVTFTLGVDSIDNCSGAQAGALDPINGMFWAWNSGYIFLKMEGISAASNSTGKRLEFHIGGYKTPNNCIRTNRYAILLTIETGKSSELVIRADLSRLFLKPHEVDFSKLSSVTDFHHATDMADNYANLFGIEVKHR